MLNDECSMICDKMRMKVRSLATITAGLFMLLTVSCQGKGPQAWIRINQLGYTPKGIKQAVWAAKDAGTITTFVLIDVGSGKEVFKGDAGRLLGPMAPSSRPIAWISQHLRTRAAIICRLAGSDLRNSGLRQMFIRGLLILRCVICGSKEAVSTLIFRIPAMYMMAIRCMGQCRTAR